ncbi:MAG: hypothetical protein R2861_01025 [Desulfobacterales bacterium]
MDVEIVSFEKFVYLPFEDEYHSIDEVPDGTQTISMTGSDIRKRIREGRRIPDWATFDEIRNRTAKGGVSAPAIRVLPCSLPACPVRESQPWPRFSIPCFWRSGTGL